MASNLLLVDDCIVHRSRVSEYRAPFGACATGEYVELSIDVHVQVQEVVLCYAYGLYSLTYSELQLTKSKDYPDRWTGRLRMPAEPGLLFYWFCLRSSNEEIESFVDPAYHEMLYRQYDEGRTYLYYVASWEGQDGEGEISFIAPRVGVEEEKYPHAFQITVYEEGFTTPDWMKGAVMYQIFPDRFFRGSDYSFVEMKKTGENRPERLFHEDWNEDVDIVGTPETGYLACDFYGGTLRGIAEKADYLRSLNVEVLYMNPICEARSNHRYDTADYLNVDPILGGIQGYKAFSQTMKEKEIKYIVDGVFSHTGADSKYFNKYGRYPGVGAFAACKHGERSQYSSWYGCRRTQDGSVAYDSWWGFTELPNVREDDLSYRDYILGPQGVVASWIAGGASGVRLDVSDELPDSFLREMRKCVKKASDGQAVILGEVWDEATNTISYGNYRDFAFGRNHDTVMGYPFREALLRFLKGEDDARRWSLTMERYREDYPDQMYYCMMNLISSHDMPRAITVMAGYPDPGDRDLQKDLHLPPKSEKRAAALMKLAFAIQMTYPGCPCTYYGDEIGMDGYRDPFNRRTYQWENQKKWQKGLFKDYQQISGLRKKYPVLRCGEFRVLYAEGDILIIERYLNENQKDHFGVVCEGPRRILCIVNRCDKMSTLVHSSVNGTITLSQAEGENDGMGSVQILEYDEQQQLMEVEVAPLSVSIIAIR